MQIYEEPQQDDKYEGSCEKRETDSAAKITFTTLFLSLSFNETARMERAGEAES